MNLLHPFALCCCPRRRCCLFIIARFPFSLPYSLVRDGGSLESRHLGDIVVVGDAAAPVGNFVSQSMTQWRNDATGK